MSPILHALVNLSKTWKAGAICALVFLVSLSWGAEPGSSSAAVLPSSAEVSVGSSSSNPAVTPISADSLLASFESVSSSSALQNATPDAFLSKPDSTTKSLKTVLYLSGGDDAPWFLLGVLYAIEEYHIPIDSVVGTSWGAWIGAMWSKGMRVDDMQRLLLEPDFEPFVGKNNIEAKSELDPFEWPISENGVPSLRYRFAVRQDSTGMPRRISKSLFPDTAGVERSLSKLRFQESLIRQSVKWKVPFSVLGCDGVTGSTNEDVIKSLPLPGNESSGEVCPYLAVPAEDSPDEFAIIVVPDPVRAEVTGNPWQRVLKKYATESLKNQPGMIVRGHSFANSSHNERIQAGFSAVESRMNNLAFLQGRKKDYEETKCNVYPWFRYNPTFDSLSAEKHASARSFWNENDTGIVAPRRFAYAMIQDPVYDSLSFDMLQNGDLIVGAKSTPVFDVAAGGFGSNAIGPNAYGELGVRFIDQMELDFKLAGFWGGSSYGVRPQVNVNKLWSKNWSLLFAYDLRKTTALKSYINDIPEEDRIYSEKRSDLSVTVEYDFYNRQKLALDFMFGNREFELDTVVYGDHYYNTYPVSPNLRYEISSGKKEKWFATEGYDFTANVGLQSVGFDLSKTDFIPIYWKILLDARYTVSPRDFATFTVGAAGGIERYKDEDDGFVYPKEFEYAALGNCFRMHPEATPWGSEWYDATLASHHYALLRASGALHYKGNGVWLFGAYVHDFEDNPTVALGVNKIVVEPALRLNYRSINVYVGMSRTVDFGTAADLGKFGDYTYFVRIGNYNLF